MRNVYLVTCSRRKLSEPALAKAIYISPSFIAARKIAERDGDFWFIASAKHGLLHPETPIEPYDLSLMSLPQSKREKWARSVSNELIKKLRSEDKIIILGNDDYANYLLKNLQKQGFEVYCPLYGKTDEEKLHWLTAYGENSRRLTDLDTFYKLLSELSQGLGGQKSFKDFKPDTTFPKKGIYFFFEENETRYNSYSTPRVVRVGTHAISRNSKATLWQRLRAHRGTNDGLGNHRSSILRLHIGSAILEKSKDLISVPTWGIGQSADKEIREREIPLERKVSSYIGNMKILWLSVNDATSLKSDRSYLEKNAIALLAGKNGPLDLPSENWLGKYCPNPAVRNSGLWNVDFVSNYYDENFLEIFSEYVDITIGKKKYNTHSIAPENWGKKKLSEKNPYQMELW